jgi:hypothetical protein
MGTRLWTDQTFLVSRWRDRWPSKIVSNWSKDYCCCWFDKKKRLSNRIKNDSRISEHPQDCSSSDSERGFGKEKVVCTVFSTLLDTWAKGRSSHILPIHYRDGRCRQKFFNKIITGEEIWCFSYSRETKRQGSQWVGETSPRPKKLKFQRSRIKKILIIFFDSQGVVHKEILPEGKTVNSEFYKGVMVRLLKRIQWVFISARLFSVPQVENEFKRTPICGSCWDPRSRKWRSKEGLKRGIFGSFSETVRWRKSLYVYQWSLFGIEKVMCLLHVPSIFKKISPKTLGPLYVCLFLNHSHKPVN